MKRLFALALFGALLTTASGAMAAPGLSARARLDAFARGLHALQGRFDQTLNGNDEASHGIVSLEAPREFRWETQAPYQQTIVADGNRVWLYDPSLEQVTVRRQDNQEAHSPLAVITDLSRLDRDFKVSDRGQYNGLSWLRLVSRADNPAFDYADLGFAAKGLARMVFRDQLGQVTEIHFSGWQRNLKLPAATFQFVPPPGTDVVGDAPDIQIRALKP